MNTNELIDKLERIEVLALAIKNRHAADAIAVHAQELIRELQQNAECLPRNLHPEPHNMDEDGVGCKPQDTDR